MRLYLAILALALEGQLAPALAQGVQPQGQAGTPGQQAAYEGHAGTPEQQAACAATCSNFALT